MLKEFKEFAMRGNVMDMAVGIIIGAAFGKIVTSLVNDVVMPPIGLLLGNVDFSNLFLSLHGSYNTIEGSRGRRRADHQIRHLHQHRHRLLDRRVRDLPGHPQRSTGCKRKQEAAPPPPPPGPTPKEKLLTEIRDVLKAQGR